MNWADLAREFPSIYDDWMKSERDIASFTRENGIMAYLHDPSVLRLNSDMDAWMWEVRYMNKEWNIVTLTDLIQSSESNAFLGMMRAIFKIIENKESVTMEDYKRQDKEFKPEDWEKAKEDVEGLMNLFTKGVVNRHKRKKFFETKRKRRTQ